MAQAVGTVTAMDARATLDALAAEPELAGRLVHRELLPGPRGALRRACRTACTTKSPPASRRAGSIGCTRTRPPRSTGCGPGRASWSRPAPRRASRSATRCRSSSRSCRGRRDTALLIFPTKALAQDQLRSLRSWLVPGLRAVTYDGDTDGDDRAWARKNANVVLTNPEMLHMGILPSHKRWATFLMRLRYVVVDELHTLRGIFGSQVAHVLRRLQRLCEHYGAHPTFCFASATIGNPGELASALCGLPVEAIDDDGSPRAERVLACWQRPLLDAHSGARTSANVETADLLARFVRSGHQTLAFTRSRRGAELVAAARRGAASKPARSARGAAGRGVPRPAICPRSGGSSNATCRAGSSSASRPRTRSSSASTSAASTR